MGNCKMTAIEFEQWVQWYANDIVSDVNIHTLVGWWALSAANRRDIDHCCYPDANWDEEDWK